MGTVASTGHAFRFVAPATPTQSYGSAFSGSLQNTGTGYLYNSYSPVIGSGDFTIEFWMTTAYSFRNTTSGIFGFGPYQSGSTSNGRITLFWSFPQNSQKLYLQNAASTSTPLISPTISVQENPAVDPLFNGLLPNWQHIAITRSNNTVRLWVNGVTDGNTVSWSTNFSNTNFAFFRPYSDLSQEYFVGRIAGFTISRGVCYYTTTFTPQKKPLLSDSTKIMIYNAVDNNTKYNDSSSSAANLTAGNTTTHIQFSNPNYYPT